VATARTATRALVAAALLSCALPATASAALARLRPGASPGPTVAARALAEIGFATVPDGTPGSLADGGAHLALSPNDPVFQFSPYQWVYAQTGFLDAWSSGTGSASTVIAIVDSGVDSHVADLQGALLPGWNMVDNNADTSDPNGHGTSMAGLAAARTNNGLGVVGACGSCSILPVRVAGADGFATWSATAAGIVWAADHGARVISLSLVGARSSAPLEAAVAYAQQKGALVVAAAGNDKLGYPEYPAALAGVISVEATDASDTPYSFSNHGPTVTLAAPGCANAVAPGDVYKLVCGTSVSTPLVAGAAGLLLSALPSATGADLAAALENGADHVSDSEYGRLNVAGAMHALAPTAAKIVAPLPMTPPAVTGTPTLGATLTATQGTWINAATTYAYQWLRCTSAGCVEIAGATQATYRIVPADLGRWIEVGVTAANSAGQAFSRSPGTVVPAVPVRRRLKKR
jgi:subtilisin family serine protease